MSTLYAAIKEKAKHHEPETLRFLSDMVKIPSFSSKEKEVVEVIHREMEGAGFDEVRIDGLGNIIGRLGSGARTIAFDSHIDTVMAGDLSQWQVDPFIPVIRDGKIWGRGTVDQKGGMASMVTAARVIQDLGLNDQYTLLFTGTVMEEDCDGLCWQYLIQEEGIRPELVVVTEPTSMTITRGQRGRMEMKLHLRGRSCHGSAPERGDNAIYKISRIALEIEKLNENLKSDPFLGKGTITVTQVVSSAPSLCAVPDEAEIHLDRRLTAGETKESALEEVKAIAARSGYSDAEVRIPFYEEAGYTGLRYPTEKYYPTWVLEEDSPWLEKARSVYQGLFDRKPEVGKWIFSTNGVAIAGMHDIPCIGFGPGDEDQSHAPDEACPIEHLNNAASFYAAFVAHLNGKI